MKNTLIVANLKANPKTKKEAEQLISSFKKLKKPSVEIVACTPSTFLSVLKSGQVKIGAQNVSSFGEGPFTGEVTASMLKSVGVDYCIVGHSERRKMGETSLDISKKIKNLLKEKIFPILCVGEHSRGQNGEHFEEISSTLLDSIKDVPKKRLSSVVIAYEPLWAISTENQGVINSDILHETVIFIKKILTDYAGKSIVTKVRIIYGGSVDGKNAKDIITHGGVDGLLVGKASLSLKTFSPIVEATYS